MVLLLCAGAPAYAQEDLTGIPASGLLADASRLLGEKSYAEALPYLTEYLERMEGNEDDRVLSMSQEIRLKLGKIMAYLDDPASAIDYLNQYMQALPLYKPREALKLLTVNLYEKEMYEECIAAATNALTQPEPRGLQKKEEAVDYEKLTKDEMGGFTARQLERIEREAKEQGEDLSEGFSGDIPDPEPEYTQKELVLIHMTLGEACTALEDWQTCLKPYRFVIENTVEEDRRGFAVLQTVKALIGLERFKEAGAFVMKLYRTNARYNVRVNMALMDAASALNSAGETDSALILYRMVLSREEMIAYQTVKMNELRRDAGLPNVEVNVVTNQTGRLETLFGDKKSDLSVQNNSAEAAVAVAGPPKSMALIRLEELVAMLVLLPPYENEVLYRTGGVYAESGRPWEAVAALDMAAARDPDGELGLRAFAESLLVRVDPLKEYEYVEQLALPFLESHLEGIGPRMVAQALTLCYQKQEFWKKMKTLRPRIEQFVPSDEKSIRQYDCELWYMQAIADLMLFNYPQVLAGFDRVLMDFPGSHRQENAVYWHAMAQLFLQHYDVALSEFNAYSATYPHGNWEAEAAFNGGVCLFGMGNIEEAQQRFTTVIQTYPDSRVYSDACSMRGDILASQGLLDEAQRDYETAIAAARDVRQDTYAVFQMASMFNLENRYSEIIAIVQAYVTRQGEAADVAKAAYWIGKTQVAQGQIGDAVETYRSAVMKYGENLRQDGVDLIITELAKLSRRLNENERNQLEESLRESAETADNVTLTLRIRVLLAKMNGSELELGRMLIAELPDLTEAPPPVLSVICKAAFESGDYSHAKEILTLFQTRYEDSDFIRDAYKLRAYDLYSAGELVEALKITAETQALYGTAPDAAWAQLMKGRIELQRGYVDFARKTFEDVLGVREWRGVPCAEAAYRLGELEEQAGALRKAFGWYQRVYFLYKGHADGYWAAEGYLASARCLQALGLENDRRNTFRAMLLDKYVNHLPQANVAHEALRAEEVQEIAQMLLDGVQTNFTVSIDAEGAE